VNGSGSTLILAVVSGVVAGVLARTIGSGVGFLALLTAFSAGAFRYAAVLRHRSQADVEWATAIGFVFGLVVALAVLVVDQLTA
jgi:ABC-type Mn2+/Zn2+ transport system permease subunit